MVKLKQKTCQFQLNQKSQISIKWKKLENNILTNNSIIFSIIRCNSR